MNVIAYATSKNSFAELVPNEKTNTPAPINFLCKNIEYIGNGKLKILFKGFYKFSFTGRSNEGINATFLSISVNDTTYFPSSFDVAGGDRTDIPRLYNSHGIIFLDKNDIVYFSVFSYNPNIKFKYMIADIIYIGEWKI